jgi:Tol biopolymer transport system component
LRKAIDVARQTAEGLAAAHERNIVHRDVKPDNVFITNDGRVKILDFGIAKLTRPSDDGARHAGVAIETESGMVVGTSGYMSPEQVRGEAVDARSDIFSFGTILYEMLTGRPPFTRGTAAETMAAILKEDPPEPLPANVPPAIERIVSRCLEKTRETRFQSARDLAFGLEFLSGTTATAAAASSISGSHWVRRPALPWVVAGALAFGLALALMLWAPWRTAPAPAPLRLRADLGADTSLANTLANQYGDATILSPDGTSVAFVAQKGETGISQLYVRRLDQLQATPLSGTDDALAPFFSPDGRWIGFSAGYKLKKIAVTGGASTTLCDVAQLRGGTWGEDGTIVFSPDKMPGTRLVRVTSDGGKPEPLTSLAAGEGMQQWPQFLPGGKAVLYTSVTVNGAFNDASLVVQSLASGTPKIVQRGGFYGRYLPSGHLVFIHDGTLFAAPFDLNRLEVTGQPVPALRGVTSNSITGGAQFSVSATGSLVYLPGTMKGADIPVEWMNHEGTTSPLRPTPANWFDPRFSPDGRRLAMGILNGTSDIWIYEWARDTLTRLTSDPSQNSGPVWTPDGRRIVFASDRADKSTSNLYWQRADGTGDAQRLTESKKPQRSGSWHPSGKFLAFEEDYKLMILPMEGDEASGWKPGKPYSFSNSPFKEAEPAFSPDGRWLAYMAAESGVIDVFVRPFPGPGGKWQVSTGGGMTPTWSPNGHELFYGVNGQITVAAFTADRDTFRAEKSRLWSEARYQTRGPNRMFDLHPDGERFALMPALQAPVGAKLDKVVFIFNFFDELRRIAPVKR